MAAFSINGVSTGIDYKSLIAGLMSAEKRPMQIIQVRQADFKDKIKVYDQLKTKVEALETAASTLTKSTGFSPNTLTVSDSTVLDATSTSAASAGKYEIKVSALAQTEKEVHDGADSATAVVNSSGAGKAFQYTYAGTQRTITVASGTTLEGLRDLINQDTGNPGVSATILNDGTKSRLVLTGAGNGDSKSITIDAGTTLNGTDSVDFTAASFTETSKAQSAKFSVDGIDVTRETNSISDVITGVTFNLKKASLTAPPASTVEIKADKTAAKTNVQAFIDAYNDVVNFVKTNSAYDDESKTGGPLLGEATARDVVDHLRSIISSKVEGLPDDMLALSQVGISTNSDGTISIKSTDTAKFDDAYTKDYTRMVTMFTGAAKKIYDYANSSTDLVKGSITLRKNGLQGVIKGMDTDLEKMQSRLDTMQANLTRQFTQLETMLRGMQSQGSFLSSAISQW